MTKSLGSLVLANHRPETVNPAKERMFHYDAIILEEPPDDRFFPMLSGSLPIDAYLETLDIEYPEFGRRMSETLRELYAAGKRIYQIEPFIDNLLEVHELFADGGSPRDLKTGSELHMVYDAERNATAALIDFYQVSVGGTFEQTVEAVKRFAQADARRFDLRDRMRADAIADLLTGQGSFYIEAGQIHFPLWRGLKRRLPENYPLTVTFLMASVVKEMGLQGHLYGPGDLLTLWYRFHPNRDHPKTDLLAARALIYNKLIAKEEILESAVSFPHTRDELAVGETVRKLSLTDCRSLFPHVRRASTETARDMVAHYLNRK